MDILLELTALKDAHGVLEADCKAATELLEASVATTESLKAQLEAKDAELKAHLEQVNTLNALLNTANVTLEEVRAEVEQLKAEHATAEQKAVEIVAKQGVAPIAVNLSASEVLTKADALTAYKALLQTSPQQAGQFYAKNRDILIN